ncbi:MAG: glycoside hydrolase family 16 protein [Oligoflexus sp.]|nr:glycoside hydrolase family 16 protein [Oligoflexus sp.]
MQNYTDQRPENVGVQQGNLIIKARKDDFNGYDYSSGRINTQGLARWKYGRIEARIKLPSGRGTWPAFWMLPDDLQTGQWPDYGEIDIMEHVGYDPNIMVSTLHTKDVNHTVNVKQNRANIKVDGAVDSFHIYAVEWFPDHMDFYTDGNKFYTFTNTGKGAGSWPFDKPFHIILNLAVGGVWGGKKGVDESIWPRQMLVDYVRVYNPK